MAIFNKFSTLPIEETPTMYIRHNYTGGAVVELVEEKTNRYIFPKYYNVGQYTYEYMKGFHKSTTQLSLLDKINLDDTVIDLTIDNIQSNIIPTLPHSLMYLKLINISIQPFIFDNVSNLYTLGLVNVSLSNVSNLPNTLLALHIDSCELNQSFCFPPHLEILQINNCTLNSLPNLPSSIVSLTLINCTINSLPKLPESLIKLTITNCPLHSLPSLPDSLEHIECRSMPTLRSFPCLPIYLDSLILSHIGIHSIESLPNELRSFIWEGTAATYLPNLPTNIEYLYLHGTSIPYLTDYSLCSYEDYDEYDDCYDIDAGRRASIEYNKLQKEWITFVRSKQLEYVRVETIKQCHKLKEELIQTVFHPSRVLKRIDTYGFEVLDE